MKFYKKKTDIDGSETGHFYGHAALLAGDAEFIAVLANLGAKCDSAEVELTVYAINPPTPLDEEAITAAVLFHGSEAKMIARADKKSKDEANAPILAKLAEIDAKSIRALRAGDTEYIATYELQAMTERAKLQ